MSIIPLNKRSREALDEFVADFKSGKVSDAIIIAVKSDDMIFIPLTSTPAAYLGWMCSEGAHAIHHLDDEEE